MGNVNTEIIKLLNFYCKKINKRIKFVIIYGSRIRDIDILMVVNSKHRSFKRFFITNKKIIDGIQISYPLLKEKLKLLDIVYTEPVLTGKCILGNKKILQKLKIKLKNESVSAKIPAYLIKEGINSFNNALECINFYKNNKISLNQRLSKQNKSIFKSRYAEWALINLSFACSYFLASKHYKCGSEIITFKELLKIKSKDVLSLRLIYSKLKQALSQKSEISLNVLNEFVSQVYKLFKENNEYSQYGSIE